MPLLNTKYFGPLEYTIDSVFDFPDGIPAFENHTAFVLVEQPHTKPLILMQSLNDQNLCFLTVPVFVADPEYRLHISNDDLEALDLPAGSMPRIGVDVSCLVLVTVSPDTGPTVNLAAPIVLNLQKRKGVQAVSDSSECSFRHPLVAREEPIRC